MSKELTEKLRNGALKSGYYYATSFIGWSSGVKEIIYPFFLSDKARGDIKEVLAPVPSYDEHNELVQKMHKLEKQLSSISEQLKEAHEVIKECQRLIKRDGVLTSTEGAIKEMLKGYLDKRGVE